MNIADHAALSYGFRIARRRAGDCTVSILIDRHDVMVIVEQRDHEGEALASARVIGSDGEWARATVRDSDGVERLAREVRP